MSRFGRTFPMRRGPSLSLVRVPPEPLAPGGVVTPRTVSDTGATITDALVNLQLRTVADNAFSLTTYLIDTFSSTATNGWAPLGSGATGWTLLQGTASYFSEAGGVGQISHGASDGTAQWMGAGWSSPHADVSVVSRFRWSTANTGTGNGQEFCLVARAADANNAFMGRLLQAPTTGALTLFLRKVVANVGTNIASGAPLNLSAITPNTDYWMRFEVQGTTLRVRLWADGSPEPSTWDLTGTEATDLQAAGDVGYRSFLPATATNTLVVSVDNFQASAPGAVGMNDSVTAGRTTGPAHYTYAPADTGSSIGDSLTRIIARPGVTDVGTTVTDAVGPRTARPGITDVGASIGDTLTHAAGRRIADTGATITDAAPQRALARLVADTGASISDAAPSRVTPRTVADQGTTITDAAPARLITRGPADTGTTITDTAHLTSVPRRVADTGATISDTLARAQPRVIADTGATITDTAPARLVARQVADTGSTISDALRRALTRPVADTGASVTDALARRAARAIQDTGSTVTDAVDRSFALHNVTDTGIAQSDAVSTGIPRLITDNGTQGAGFLDTFTRTNSSDLGGGWGGAGFSGTGWTIQADGSRGVATPSLANTSQARVLSDSQGDADWYADVQFATAAAGGLQEQGIIARFVDNNNYIRCSLRQAAAGAWTLRIESARSGGTSIATFTLTGVDAVTNPYRIHLHLAGLTASASVWQVGTSEPGSYQVTGTLSATLDPASGASGVRWYVGPGNTNLGSQYLDNYQVGAGATSGISDTVAAGFKSGVNVINVTASDTGVTVTDAVALLVARPIQDVGSTITDALTRAITRPVTDVGASVSDAVGRPSPRAIADTGASVADSVSTRRIRTIADTGASIADSVRRAISRQLADTGVSQADVVSRSTPRTATDTGTTITDAVRIIPGRAILDAGASIADTLIRAVGRRVADTGSSISDVVTKGGGIIRTPSDTGGTITDVVTRRVLRPVTDAGASITDALVKAVAKLVTDTGVAQSDSVRRGYGRQPSDTGTTISDSLRRLIQRRVTDAGATITDGAGKPYPVTATDNAFSGVAPYLSDPFSGSASNGWDVIPSGGTGWTFTQGTASYHSEGGGVAQIAIPTGDGTTQWEQAGWSSPQADVSLTCRFQMSSAYAGTGTGQEFSLPSRINVARDTYALARLLQDSTGNLVLTLRKTVANVSTIIATGSPSVAAITPGTWYRMRFEVEGSAWRVRVWPDGSPEPTAWDLTATESVDVLASGDVGVRVFHAAGGTNPVTFTVDDFAATAPGAVAGGMTDTVSIRKGRVITAAAVDTGASVTDRVTLTRILGGRAVTDTGVTLSDALVRGFPRQLTDSAFTPTAEFLDTFSRTVTGNLGGSWVDAGFSGTGWTFSVDGNRGVGTPGTANQSQARTLGDNRSDNDWMADFQFASAATGAFQEMGVATRLQDNNHYVRAQIRQSPTGVVTLRLEVARSTGTVLLQSASMPGADPVAQPYTIHVNAAGLTVQANAYPAGSAEPAGWMASGTLLSTDPATGASGIRFATGAGNTNLGAMYVDNFQVGVGAGLSDVVVAGFGSTGQAVSVSDVGAAVSDALAARTRRLAAVSDTGAAVTDTVVSARGPAPRRIADVGVAFSDAVSRVAILGRAIADVGVSLSDAVRRSYARTASDVGVVIGDALVVAGVRSVSDTGASIADQVALLRVAVISLADVGSTVTDVVRHSLVTHAITDVGAVVSDTLGRPVVRAVSDRAVTIADSVIRTRLIARTVTDTGTLVSDSLVRRMLRQLADVGATILDSLPSGRSIRVSDVGAAVGDALQRLIARRVADVGMTQADAVRIASRQISDVGSTVVDTVTPRVALTRQVADAGAAIGDTLSRQLRRLIADTGAAVADALGGRRSLAVADVGVTLADTLQGLRVARGAADVGATVADSLARPYRARAISDIGSVILDALRRQLVRQLADLGATISDAVTRRFTPGTIQVGTYLLDYGFIPEPGMSFIDAFARTQTGLGSTPAGQPYTSSGTWTLDGSSARITPAANTSQAAMILQGWAGDEEALLDVGWSAIPVGANVNSGPFLRSANTSATGIANLGYEGRLVLLTNGTVQLQLQRARRGFTTSLGFVNLTTAYVPGTMYRVRLRVQGNEVSVKAWQVGSAEPASWSIGPVSDGVMQAGYPGFYTATNPGMTNTPTFIFQNWSVVPLTAQDTVTLGRVAAPANVNDVGATIIDALLRRQILVRLLTDSGAMVSDSLRRGRVTGVSDVGSVIVDSLRRQLARQLADQGVTQFDAVGLNTALFRVLLDVGANVRDSVTRYRQLVGPLTSSPSLEGLSTNPRAGTLQSNPLDQTLGTDPRLRRLSSEDA